jgi:hypothetical protein
MPLDEEWNIEDELQQRKDLLKKYEQNSKLLEATPIRDWEPERPTENLDFKMDSTDKAIAESTYLAQGSGDHPNMRTASKQLHKMPTPDEAEEQGIIGQFIDGVSDFSLGLATGVGYGVDELAASATSLMNALTPDEIMEDSDEYTGRYISKYMDTITERAGLDEGAGEAGRAIGQFMIGWIPALRAVKLLSKAQGLSKLGKGVPANVIASGLAGGTAFAPDHQNLGNDLATVDNHLAGAVSRFLATDPNDSEAKNRLRNAIQEGGLAVVGDKVLVPVLKGAGGLVGKAVKPVHEWFIDALDLHKQTAAVKVLTKDGTQKVPSKKVFVTEGNTVKVIDDESLIKEAKKAGNEFVGPLKGVVEFTVKKGKTVAQSLADQTEIQENFRSLRTSNERMEYAQNIGKAIAEESKTKETTAQWSKKGLQFAMNAGFDVDTLRQVHKEGYVSSEMIYGLGHMAGAIDNDLTTALENSKLLMGAVDATKEEIMSAEASVVRALADSLELQQMIKEAGSSSGKSLRAVQGVVKDLGENFKKSVLNSPDAEQVLKFFKTSRVGGMEVPRVIDMLYEAHMQKGKQAMQKVIGEGFKSGGMQMFIEAWINQGLLSNPGTHIMNLVIGNANLLSHPISQVTAATISKIPFANKVLGTDTVTYREAFGSMYGMLAGLTKAFQLSLKAGVSGDSAWGGASKIDNYGMQHIAARSFDMENTSIGLALDYMGSLTRAPGRFLLMEDEFVKTVAGEMKKHSLAWRYAYANTNAATSAFKKFTGTFSDKVAGQYKEIIDNPQYYKERIGDADYSFESQIQEFADLVTFQKKTGKIANYLTQAGINYPLLKLGMPFVKVLSNIPKYTVQHSPLGLLMQNQEFKRGGQSRMLEIGRMAYGSMLMWYGAQMYQNGQMTGTGPREYWKSINAQQTGAEPPRSIKVKPAYAKHNSAYWIDISRFSPYSNLLMMGADISQMIDAKDDLNGVELIEKGLTSIQKNLVDPTWAPSLHKVLGAVADSSSEPGDWTRALKSITGTLQPAFVRSYEKIKSPGKAELKTYDLHPEKSEDYRPEDWSGYTAQMLATSSAHSDLIPTARNIFGDQIKHDAGTDSGLPGMLHNPMWSFVTIRKADETPAIVHMMRDLEMEISRPRHIVPVGKVGVRLTPHEYDEYVRRIGKNKDFFGHNIKEAFTRTFNSTLYQKDYKIWANDNNPHAKAKAKKNMVKLMTDVYTMHRRAAKESMIFDYNLHERAQELRKQFGGNTQ